MLRLVVLAALANVALGASSVRIVGGTNAPEGKYPWMVSLRNQRNEHFCGASILDETTVITAAHCADYLKPADLTVNVGGTKLNETTGRYNVAKIRVHRQWNYDDLKNDIIILKLATAIQFSDKVKPIKLPRQDQSAGSEAWLSGWGSTYLGGPAPNNLQEFKVSTVATGKCNEYIPPFPVDRSQVCTFIRPGQGACHGDSGSPLVNTNGEQIGIASWVMIPCAKGKPDVFTNIYHFLDWIEENRK